MPICTLRLLSLGVPIPQFLQSLSSSKVKPLVISRVVRWIILPTSTSTSELLAQNIHWDILLILPSTDPLPQDLQKLVQHQWSVQAGVPSRLVQDFEAKNKKLLKPEKSDVPPLTGALDRASIADSAQGLELSPELLRWAEEFGKAEGSGAVSMLNLLAFKPGLKSEYLKYGAEFAKSVGSRRGGNAKIVGSVIHSGGQGDGGEGWDEVALAHYQAANKRYRVGSLKDTFILCTSELGIEQDQAGLWRKELGSRL
jgi:hypothetical protein